MGRQRRQSLPKNEHQLVQSGQGRHGRISEATVLPWGLWSPGPLGDRTLPGGDIDLNPEIWESSSWSCSSRLRQAYVAAKVAGAEPACRKAIGRAEA
jgi:hypothetical protein